MTTLPPLTGPQLRNHAKILAGHTDIQGPVTPSLMQVHSTNLLAEYAAVLRQLLALAIRRPDVRKWLHADPIAAGLYTWLWGREIGMEIPKELLLAEVMPHAVDPLPGPAPQPPAAQA